MVPYRCRGLAMLIVMTWSVGIGAYSVTAKWHRLSDTIGADFAALIVGSIAALVLLRYGAIQRTEYRPKLRVIYVVLMSIGGFMTLAVGALLGYLAGVQDLRDPVIEWDLYLAANTLATAGSIIAGLVYWATWRRREVAQQLSGKELK